MNVEQILAHPDQKKSAIRELLRNKVKISFGGGLPDPKFFPIDRIAQLRAGIPPERLQYGTTEPLPEFTENVGRYLQREIGIDALPEEVSVGCGSQAILATLAATLVRPGQKIVVDAPTYVGALVAFRTQNPVFVTVPVTEKGPDLKVLKQVLKGNSVQFYYTIPNFGNPTGITYDSETREAIAQLAKETDTLIIEDDPYGLFRYRGRKLPTLRELAPTHTAYVGTASKIIAPDMRTAWIVAPPRLIDAYNTQAGAIQLFTSQTNQLITAGILSDDKFFHDHIDRIKTAYGERLSTMIKAFEEKFPPGITWTKPDGGMFIWVTGLPADTQTILEKAIERNVVFAPGAGFYANEPVPGTARFNFSNAEPKKIAEGVQIIAEILAPYY